MIEQEKISLPKAYEPQAVEGKWYRFWEERGYFKPRPQAVGRPTFVISMPPPNVTGALHLGHAITATIEDILIRYHRMRGDDTLWVPGEETNGPKLALRIAVSYDDAALDGVCKARKQQV